MYTGRRVHRFFPLVLHNPLKHTDLLPHSFFALKDGGQLRYATFSPSPPPRGTVLIIPGAREFIEKKYVERGRPLMERGFRVIIVEPRGQGLSSRFLDGDRRQRNHIDDFSTHIRDLRAFYNEIVSPSLSKPLIIHGHSLGAHIMLRWLAEDNPSQVDGAFVTAPMVSYSGMAAHMAFYGVSWANARLFGQESNYTPMQHDFGGEDLVFAGNRLTHDENRFRIMENYFKKFPDMASGGVTWGWALAALQSMGATHTWPYLARIGIPVLSLTGDQDSITPPSDIGPFMNMIPRVRMHTIAGARHDLLNETDDILAHAWKKIDDFLKITMATERRTPQILYPHPAKQSAGLPEPKSRIRLMG